MAAITLNKYFFIIFLFLMTPFAFSEAVNLTVKEAAQMAAGQSEEVKKVENDLKAARAQIHSSYATFLPTLDARLATGTVRSFESTSATTGVSSTPTSYQQVDRNKYTGSLVFTQPLFSGFSSMSALGAAQSNVSLQDNNLKSTKSAIILDTIKLYLSIQLKHEEIAAEEEVKELRGNRFKETTSLVRLGRSTRLDLLQAEYALKAQDPVILKLKSEQEGAAFKLKRNLGIALDKTVELKDSLVAVFKGLSQFKLPTLDEAYRVSQEQNFSIKSKTLELKKYSYDIDSMTTKHWPQLDFVMTASVDAKLREDISSERSRTYSGELQLNIPLFSGLNSISNYREKISRVASKEHELTHEKNQLFIEISDLYRKLNQNRAEIEANEINSKLADESIKSSESLYAVGKATMTEVLDSYARKVQARRNLANALYERVITTFEIQHAIGLMPSEISL